MEFDKLVVNSAITQLITSGDFDPEAARTVIEFGSQLPKRGLVKIEGSYKGSGGPQIRGETGLGSVGIEDDKGKSHEWSFGVTEKRIGHYKMEKEWEGLLRFHHFWASDIGTESESKPTPNYYLRYEPDTLEFRWLAQEVFRPLFSFWWFHFSLGKKELLYGNFGLRDRRFGPINLLISNAK